MKQTYFVYNGKRYNSGTFIVLSQFNHMAMKVCKNKVKFVWYDSETNEYGIEECGNIYTYSGEYFSNSFIGIYEEIKQVSQVQNQAQKLHTFSDELAIDGLFIAWVWYVFIMLVGVIFYDIIGIWIFASVVFFNYRDKKLKEAGYK